MKLDKQENMQASYDIEKYEAWVNSQVNKALKNQEDADALICFFYPQYRLDEVSSMAAGDVQVLLRVAMQQKFGGVMDMLAANAASQSEQGYKKLNSMLMEKIKEL